MNHFRLTDWVGSGTSSADARRPRGADHEAWSAIDLGSHALVASSERGPGLQLGAEAGDGLPLSVLRRFGNALGLNLDRRNLGQLAAELLTGHAGPRWKPLRPEGNRWAIHLGELLWSAPCVRGGATVTDDFNRADSSSLGANWLEITGVDWTISSNTLSAPSGGDSLCENVNSVGVDHSTDIDIISGAFGGPSCRSFATSVGCYYFRTNGGVQYELYKYDGGWNSLGVQASSIPSPPFTMRVKAVGSTITGYEGAGITQKVQVTDTFLASQTRGGVYCALGGSFDNFVLADVIATLGPGMHVQLSGT